MKIVCISVGELQSNSYILYDEVYKEAIIFDCGDEPEKISDYIEKHNLNLKYIILTHGHFDHIMAASELKLKYPDAKLGIHADEEKFLSDKTLSLSDFVPYSVKIPAADFTFENNDKITTGTNTFTVIHTPGHTLGSCCFLCEDILISGDTLFKQSIGRCDFPTGSMPKIENSIVNILYKLNDNTKVYPGHGEPTTIGYEKKNNCFFRI
ncbi:MAG: MBL fold metallo-hydrolase [Clostridia bacterium]|nr:MBL fold metallo-hydrolase [Clostridia bacterium]